MLANISISAKTYRIQNLGGLGLISATHASISTSRPTGAKPGRPQAERVTFPPAARGVQGRGEEGYVY